jgi:toxin ParE1/3/4
MPDPERGLVWSAFARADLTDIWNHFSNVVGQNTADNIVRKILDACVLIEDHPFAGRARDEIRPGLRSIIINPHVVFYRVQNDQAEVVRVLDGRRDLDEVFAEFDK